MYQLKIKQCPTCKGPLYVDEHRECYNCRQKTLEEEKQRRNKKLLASNERALVKCLVGNNPVDWSKVYE